MQRTAVCLLAALAAVSLAGSARAQLTPFAVEIRGGAALPTGDFGDELDPGWALGVNASYRVLPVLAVYAGASITGFRADDPAGARPT